MAEFMRVNGVIIINMEKVIKNLITVLSMMDLMFKENPKDMEDIVGIMDNHIKVNGLME